MDSKNIVVIGGRIAANMTAAYLKKQHPDLSVTVVGRSDKRPPLVGESLTEFSSNFLKEIGMGEALEQRHFPKFGLSFYFKENLSEKRDRRYAVHEAPGLHPIASYLINRGTFDEELIKLNRARGIQFVEAHVQEVEISKDGPHRLTLKDALGNESSLTARWIIDATGRRRFLARKLGLHRKPLHQRSTFWFRLAGFDPAILQHIEAVRSSEPPYDPYYMAHHFLGRGNWIWCIPMKSEEHRNFISIGITYRPDLLQKITTMEDFLRQADNEHAVIAELVRSGTVVDTNAYLNYLYETPKLYSQDRWFLVGDAADTSDPLYSTGMVNIAIQATQVSELIGHDLKGGVSAGFARDLELAYKTIRDTTQREITSLYEVIHDPHQAHWRIHITTAVYFFFMLPQTLSGYLVDPVGARWIRKTGEQHRDKIVMLNQLLAIASARLGKRTSAEITNLFAETVNWTLKEANERDVARHLAHLLHLMVTFRLKILKDAGWRGWQRHLPICVVDVFLALFLRLCFGGRSIKGSRMIRFYVGWGGADRGSHVD